MNTPVLRRLADIADTADVGRLRTMKTPTSLDRYGLSGAGETILGLAARVLRACANGEVVAQNDEHELDISFPPNACGRWVAAGTRFEYSSPQHESPLPVRQNDPC